MHAAPYSSVAASTPTKALLVSAALAAVQTGLFLLLLPALATLAPAAPPLYALVASANTALPMLARILTRGAGTATITAGITTVMVVAFSPIGILSAVPLLTAGAVFDLVAWKGAVSTRRLVLGAAAVGVALFVISLAVFSPEHLVPGMLMATLIGRLAGEAVIAVTVSATVRLLRRAGVGR
ncbi:hypothetical protein ABS642_10280 [Microbacterium sp. A8/3-1]|uniref:Uncharacterized protein n=1 Tax=Microbacterium sp. A8/3-1 TaxID=3160749 RepID=A0AAU7W2T1_9MICO